jgi:hypothetical protein
VTEDALEHAQAERESDKAILGQTDVNRLSIVLDPEQPPSLKRATFLHELLHAAFSAAGPRPDSETEETVTRLLEGPLLQTLRDNPDLVRYLTAPD